MVKTKSKVVCIVSVAKLDEYSGGVDRVGCFLIRYFKSRGYEIISYYWRSYTDNPEYFLIDEVYQFPDDNLYSPKNTNKLIKIINQHNVSLIFDISFVGRIHEICYIAKEKCKIKSILLYQGDPLSYTKSIIDRLSERRFLHTPLNERIKSIFKIPFSLFNRYYSAKKIHAQNMFWGDLYVVLSQYYVKEIINLLHISSTEKICTVSNAVEPFSIKKKKKQVIFVGRMDWQKRVDRLLRIWKIAQPYVPNWTLILVGDGPYMEKYKKYAENISLIGYKFVGSQPAQPFIEESSILCVTSTHEGFGLTLVEAQSCGCVPIAFNSYAAIRDIIDDGVSGMLIRPFSEKVFAKRLIELCKDLKKRESMASEGIQSAKKFHPNIIEQKWDSILDRLK